MEISRLNILSLEEIERRETFIEEINNCPVCGQHLRFKHDQDFLNNRVKEVAHCDNCHAQIREEDFNLQ